MRTLNLGILAHVDAGKTSLTERLLYTAGVIDHLGRVDSGDTQTDTLALERQRGITIKTAVTSFVTGSGDRARVINLIDTPGHPDFIAEVERVLDILDCVILVISAVEGVQAQTRVLTRALRRVGVPTLILVNKIDRAGARTDELLAEIEARLRVAVVPLSRVEEAGSRRARTIAYASTDPIFHDSLVERLSRGDDQLLDDFVADRHLSAGRLGASLVSQTIRCQVCPVIFGSAITGAGMDQLMAVIADILPATEPVTDADPSGVVFKIDRGTRGEKIAYVRSFGGRIAERDMVTLLGSDDRTTQQKVSRITVFDRAGEPTGGPLEAGRIGKLWGLAEARIGDQIGTGARHRLDHYFTAPTLETVVSPVDDADRGPLRVALDQLAEQDPLINVRQDDAHGELSVCLYGEVQKEVIGATLLTDFGIDATFSESSTICVERPVGVGTAVEFMRDAANPFLATVGLRVEPEAGGSGITFDLEKSVHGTMPVAFFTAVEETVYETCRQALHGWQLIDARITLTHTGYAPRQSHAHQGFSKSMSSTGADFRDLTPLVVMAALRSAATEVLEPVHRFRLELPAALLDRIYPVLAAHGAIPQPPVTDGTVVVMEGDIPAGEVHGLEQELPSLTRGEGVLDSPFDRYRPVVGRPPERRRTDRNPLDRSEYLLRATRGKGARI
ncbi:tetracycline resistance protein, tetM/tetO subfamily [Microlunatus endophyticus]|uniref:Tetracycline resistance protein, tetM/tetO subfamily n=1 Tax=Microlunatus endophyticus TaxID=1716077 RepID=A0A917S4D4_9ACTN|nr:tetracycline resistance protein, tetM/tetO subfamily [Microlunatus endophyticus]